MNRRDALKNVALFMGGTVIGGSAFLAGCQSDRRKEVEVAVDLFSEEDIRFMNEIGEIIIPETDTPGAKAAGVGSFMARMVSDCYDEKQQRTFISGLKKMKKNFSKEFDLLFEEAKDEERSSYINNLEIEVATYYRQKKQEDPEHFYRMLKELTLLGYFTSEVGATQALNYIQNPGSYQACIPYEKGGKAWAVA